MCGYWGPSSMVIITFGLVWQNRLGAKAFFTVLSVKQTGYKTILVWLKEILDSTKCGRLQRNMDRIASRHSISKRVKYWLMLLATKEANRRSLHSYCKCLFPILLPTTLAPQIKHLPSFSLHRCTYPWNNGPPYVGTCNFGIIFFRIPYWGEYLNTQEHMSLPRLDWEYTSVRTLE